MLSEQVWVRHLLIFVWVLFLAGNVHAQSASPNELELLKAQVAAQQEQIRQLRELLGQQQARLETLERYLNGRPSAHTVAAQPAQLEEHVEQLEATVAETRKESEKRWKGLGNLSFSGDLRVRYEPFFQAGTPERHRPRARLRFQAAASITDELTAGLRLATGSLDDPISTNQTFSGFFTRKTVGFDRFWLSYKPERAHWLTLTGGKFAYPWYRTELTFDDDLNPEGFSQSLSFYFSDSPLANLTLVGFQLPFNELELAGDSFIGGGQIQTHWKLGDQTRLSLYAAGINFHDADSIARALGAGTLRPSLPLTNAVRRDALGNIIGYASRFAYLDLVAELNHPLRPRWPLRLTLNFANNLRAANGERSGYWAELRLGQTSEKGDWRFSYTLTRIEREAVIGAYNYSDLRASTNLLGHRFIGGY